MKKINIIVFAVIKKNNKFLLTKRESKNKRWNKWQFPGGGLEFGEKLEQALKREIKEELGCEILIERRINKIFEIFRIKDNFHGILIGYICRLKDDNCQIILNNEASKYNWFTINEIKKLDSLPGLKEIIKFI